MHKMPVSSVKAEIAFAVSGFVKQIIIEQVPALKSDMPETGGMDTKSFYNDTTLVVLLSFADGTMPSIGKIDEAEAQEILQCAGPCRTYKDLRALSCLSKYFLWNKTVVLLNVDAGHYEWNELTQSIIDWLNEFALPRAQDLNRQRVQAAIPAPPQYSFDKIKDALWVLEHQGSCGQGTAFDFAHIGVITNQHVIEGEGAIFAFRSSEVSKKYPVEVVKENSTLDLAIICVIGAERQSALDKFEGDELQEMDHVAVCGFPNYRLGDSGILSPGLVVGSRMKSGVRRLLTNAGIVAGMSGGPAIGGDNRVVGVCVTGSDFMQGGRDNEDQSIIPISAIDILLSQ